MQQKSKKTSLLMLILSMVIFGTIGIFRRYIPWSSGMLAFSRGLLGTIFLTAFVKIRGRKIRHQIGAKKLIRLIISGAVMGFNWILLFEAYHYTTVSVATLCYYMQPVILILLSPLILKEKLLMKKLVCAGIAIVGMVLVSGVFESGQQGPDQMKGIFLGLAAAALYATVILLNKTTGNVDPYEKTIIQLASSAAVMIPYLLITEDFTQITFDLTTVLLVLAVGLVHTGFAYAMYFGCMEGLKAQTLAIFSYIDPITALILSGLILQEALSPAGITGAVLILGAAAASELEFPRRT